MKKIIIITCMLVFHLSAHDPSASCDNKKGDQFVESFFSLPLPAQKKYFALITLLRKKELLKHMTFEQYEKFLNSISENDWQQLLQSVSADEKRTWPQTIEEQKNAIQEIKEHADNVKDVVLVGYVVGYAIFPPSLLLYGAQAAYQYVTESDPVKDFAINKKYCQYLREKFNVVK